MKDRLKRNVTVDAKGCWLWGSGKGYGRLRLSKPRRLVGAHRASWEAFVGPIPSGAEVLHKCDVPACINPAHLFLGTQADNIRDCSHKGRLVDNQGTKHGMAKLTEDQVRQIRRMGGTQASIAAHFNISDSTVRYIKSRKLWAHLT